MITLLQWNTSKPEPLLIGSPDIFTLFIHCNKTSINKNPSFPNPGQGFGIICAHFYCNLYFHFSDGRMQIETSDCFSTLTIVDIHPEDCGRLQIKVGNKLGADVAFASLTVEGKFTYFHKSCTSQFFSDRLHTY